MIGRSAGFEVLSEEMGIQPDIDTVAFEQNRQIALDINAVAACIVDGGDKLLLRMVLQPDIKRRVALVDIKKIAARSGGIVA